MRSLTLTLLFLPGTLPSFAQNNVTISGTVADQIGRPLPEVKIELLLSGNKSRSTTTDTAGRFTLEHIPRDRSYIITGAKHKYLGKTEAYKFDRSISRDTAYIHFSLRERSVARINTARIGPTDLGMTVRSAIRKFRIDTTEAILQNEPPGIARGIEAELGDSTILYLQINRKANFGRGFKDILNARVVGIGLAFANCKTKYWGTGFVWWGLDNPYCKDVK